MSRKRIYPIKYCKKCHKILKQYNKHGYCMKHLRENHQYIVRVCSKNESGTNYALTIPKEAVKKYNLYKKKFSVRISPKGWFILYTKK